MTRIPKPTRNAGAKQAAMVTTPSVLGGGAAQLPRRLRLDLALQGGGSHGAFTWGVLDRLLEDERFEVAGISGTSAGAMNAVALAAGLMEGGREGARACLRRFWEAVAAKSPFAAWSNTPWAGALGPNNPWLAPWLEPWQQFGRLAAQQLSPYQLNPLNLNPLRDVLAQTVDFERVRCCHRTQLFIAATHVATGELRIFRQDELTADMVLASACLPLLFQAVEVDGEAYWDGGYAGNPTLLPLIAETDADDLLLVPINPSCRADLPTSANAILERTSEVTFNASLLKELRTIALVQEALATNPHPENASGRALFQRVGNLRLHRMGGEAVLSQLGASSKTQTDGAFLERLHTIGRQAAGDWLQAHAHQVGKCSTYALPQLAIL